MLLVVRPHWWDVSQKKKSDGHEVMQSISRDERGVIDADFNDCVGEEYSRPSQANFIYKALQPLTKVLNI